MTVSRILAVTAFLVSLVLPAGADPAQWRTEWPRTDFSGSAVAFCPLCNAGLIFDRRLDGTEPLSRVVRVGNRAWPLERIAAAGELTEAGVTINRSAGQASALDDGPIAKGRDVGSIRVQDAATGRDLVHDVIFAFAFQAFPPDGIWMMPR